MKVNTGSKRYWGRTGPDAIFGSDWKERKHATNEEAEEIFDYAWDRFIREAIDNGKVVAPERARKMIPDDKRAYHFDDSQEHREFQLDGRTHLAQINRSRDELTQMWHLKTKRSAPTDLDANTPDPSVSRSDLKGMSKEELALLIMDAAAILQIRL